MLQPNVTYCGCNHQDYTITVAIDKRRVEFFIIPDRYDLVRNRLLPRALNNEWFNQAVTILVNNSNMIHFEGDIYRPQDVNKTPPWSKQMGNRLPEPSDFSKTPSAEYPFTLIAPTAKSGLIYQGQRYWHKTEQAALEYATYIYDANPQEKFDLVVVKAHTQIRPKPMIELQSTSFASSGEKNSSAG